MKYILLIIGTYLVAAIPANTEQPASQQEVDEICHELKEPVKQFLHFADKVSKTLGIFYHGDMQGMPIETVMEERLSDWKINLSPLLHKVSKVRKEEINPRRHRLKEIGAKCDAEMEDFLKEVDRYNEMFSKSDTLRRILKE